MVGYVSPRVKRAASPSSTLSLETSAWPMLAPLSKHLTSHRSSRLFVCVFLSGTVWMCVPTSDGGIHNCNDAFAAKVDALKSRLIGNACLHSVATSRTLCGGLERRAGTQTTQATPGCGQAPCGCLRLIQPTQRPTPTTVAQQTEPCARRICIFRRTILSETLWFGNGHARHPY
jgi:hypothetical protein